MRFLFFISFIFAALGVLGWIANIIKMILSLGDLTLTPLFIARVAGIVFPPLGAILGYF